MESNNSKEAHGIMFHHFFDDSTHPNGQGAINKEQFRRIIIWLRYNYNIISALEWQEKALNNQLNDNDICITFDDNLKCQYDIALPILEEFDIQAFWFIYTGPLTGTLDRLEPYRYYRSIFFENINDFYKAFNKKLLSSIYKDEVYKNLNLFDHKEYLQAFSFYTPEDKIFRYTRDYILGEKRYQEIMDEMINDSGLDLNKIAKLLWSDETEIKYLHNTGHIIGLHSHRHPTQLNLLSTDEQLYEYKCNKEILEQITGSIISTMSHPCNSYNNDTLEILNNLGIKLGFRSNMECGYSSSLEYPRYDHTLLISKIENI